MGIVIIIIHMIMILTISGARFLVGGRSTPLKNDGLGQLG